MIRNPAKLDELSGIQGEEETGLLPASNKEHPWNTIDINVWSLVLSFLPSINLASKVSLINPFFRNCALYKNSLPLISIQKAKITKDAIKNISEIISKTKKLKYGQRFSAQTRPNQLILGSTIKGHEQLDINPTDRFHFHTGTDDNGFILM